MFIFHLALTWLDQLELSGTSTIVSFQKFFNHLLKERAATSANAQPSQLPVAAQTPHLTCENPQGRRLRPEAGEGGRGGTQRLAPLIKPCRTKEGE